MKNKITLEIPMPSRKPIGIAIVILSVVLSFYLTRQAFTKQPVISEVNEVGARADIITTARWLYSQPIPNSYFTGNKTAFLADTVPHNLRLVKSVFEEEYTFKGTLNKSFHPNVPLRRSKRFRFSVIHLMTQDKQPKIYVDGQWVVDFSKTKTASVVLFLRKRNDGLLEPVSGQQYPGMSFYVLQSLQN